MKNAFWNRLVLITASLSAVSWVYVLCEKYYRFGFVDWDLAIIAQAMWQLSHGSQYVPLMDYHFFGDHANFIALLFVPLYRLLPHPLVLLGIKIFFFHAAALSVYVIAKRWTSAATGFLLMLLYLTFPAHIFAILYEFNFDCVAPVLLIWGIYFYKIGRFKPFFILMLTSILIKENLALLLPMFGLASLFSRRRNKMTWSFIPVITGLTLFALIVLVIIPYLRGSEGHGFLSRYRHLGDSVPAILWNVVFHPWQTLSMIFDSRNLVYLTQLFGAFTLFSLASPEILLLGLPFFLQHLLSSHPPEHTIYYHYGYVLGVFIFMSALWSLRKIQRSRPTVFQGAVALLVTASLMHTIIFLPKYPKRLSMLSRSVAHQDWHLIDRLPDNTGVIATFSYLAPLSSRHHLYSFHKIYAERFQNPERQRETSFATEDTFRLPDEVNYALIDFMDPWIRLELGDYPDTSAQRIEQFFTDHKWHLVAHHNGRFLLKRMPDPEQAISNSREVHMPVTIRDRTLNIRIWKNDTPETERALPAISRL